MSGQILTLTGSQNKLRFCKKGYFLSNAEHGKGSMLFLGTSIVNP